MIYSSRFYIYYSIFEFLSYILRQLVLSNTNITSYIKYFSIMHLIESLYTFSSYYIFLQNIYLIIDYEYSNVSINLTLYISQ
jgi:hypothetical protein